MGEKNITTKIVVNPLKERKNSYNLALIGVCNI